MKARISKVVGAVATLRAFNFKVGEVLNLLPCTDGQPMLSVLLRKDADPDDTEVHQLGDRLLEHARVEFTTTGLELRGFIHKETGESFHDICLCLEPVETVSA